MNMRQRLYVRLHSAGSTLARVHRAALLPYNPSVLPTLAERRGYAVGWRNDPRDMTGREDAECMNDESLRNAVRPACERLTFRGVGEPIAAVDA